jgi:uncharacterized protein (DUF362 family)
MRSKVAVLKTTPSTVLEDYARLLDLAGVKQALDARVPTILKDNISWHFPFLSANTTPWQLEGTIRGLQRQGLGDLWAVHNETVVTNSPQGQKLCKLAPVYQEYKVVEKENFNPRHTRWITYTPKAKMAVLPRIYPEGITIPEIFVGKNIVHLPTLKTHIYTTSTGAMKNAFGGLLNTRRHYTHTWIHETLVDLLKVQKEIHPGLFAVMDGTIAGDGAGPRTMHPHITNLILASADQVAIDAVATKLMGFDPMKVKYIAMAQEEGLGTGDPSKIDLVGDDVSGLNLHFMTEDNIVKKTANVLWFGPLKGIQKLFFHTPLVYVFVMASYLYHDYLWWPILGKARMRPIMESEWGKLFKSY